MRNHPSTSARPPTVCHAIFTLVLGLWLSAATRVAGESPARQLAIDLPADFQVHQRSSSSKGAIRIEASLPSGIEAGDSFHARLSFNNAWQPIATLTNQQAKAIATINAPAGGWFRLETRITRQRNILVEASVEHVGVGEIFVIAGQSNSANHGEKWQRPKSLLVVAYSGNRWAAANDPQPGATGNGGSFIPPFADAIAERFQVPVGIIACGVGATSVREWLPQGHLFPNPPTLTNHVAALGSGEWQSGGAIFRQFITRLRALGPHGFRAVLWHQGESDANQRDPSRTLPGQLYTRFMEQLIRDSRRDVGWEFPWFVAQASYHTPDDPASPDIRAAQSALWKSGIAIEGPDTDALTGDLRDNGGKGVHFSERGLREHAARWVEKVAPWLEQQLAQAAPSSISPPAKVTGPTPRLITPGMENFTVEGRPAFVFLAPASKRTTPQPWIFYAPTLPAYPDGAERWMHEQFLAAGIAVAGVDVGEAYGSPKSHSVFDALHRELTTKRGFAAKPCLFGRSRGGLWVSSWAIANPSRVAGIIGIYPVFDFRTYPGLKNTAPAYDLTPAELETRLPEFNPVARISTLARAKISAAFIHGDVDKVVPLKENSAEFLRVYREAGAESLVKLIILEGQGHNFYESFFHSQELVDFAIARAREGALPQP